MKVFTVHTFSKIINKCCLSDLSIFQKFYVTCCSKTGSNIFITLPRALEGTITAHAFTCKSSQMKAWAKSQAIKLRRILYDMTWLLASSDIPAVDQTHLPMDSLCLSTTLILPVNRGSKVL